MLEYCKQHRAHAQNNKEHPLWSYCSIRNIEILNDFYNKLKTNFGKRKFAADNRESLIEFFKGVQGYVIKTYKEKNENDEKEWYQIDFNFVSEFIKVLENNEIEDLFNEIFHEKISKKQKNTKKIVSGFPLLREASKSITLN